MMTHRWLPIVSAAIGLAVAGVLLLGAFWVERAGAPVQVRFSGDVIDDVPVTFGPVEEVVEVMELGRPYRVTYRLTNLSDEPVFVQPVRHIESTGYLDSIQIVRCYCWLGHRLDPHEEVDLPVWFIVGSGWLGQSPGDFHVSWTIHPGGAGAGRVAADQVLDEAATHPETAAQ